MSEASDGTDASQPISNQLASLVPTFDPSKDDLQVYSQKVMLLLEAWPTGRYTELATRAHSELQRFSLQETPVASRSDHQE